MSKKPTYEELERYIQELEKIEAGRVNLAEKHRGEHREDLEKPVEDHTTEPESTAAKLNTLVNTIPDLVVMFDTEGTITFSNDALGGVTGYDQGELLGKNMLTFISPGDRERALEHLVKAHVEKLGPQDYELILKNGTHHPFEVNADVIRNAQGVPVGMLNVCRDIAVRRQVEKEQVLEIDRLAALLQLNQMTDATLREIADFALEEAVRLTESKIGYLTILNENETILTMHAWSKTAMHECAISNKPMEYSVADTGLWGEAVRQRKAIITNDYTAANPLKNGLPTGHVSILRHMNVPVFDKEKIVVVAGVGNKEAEYTETDVNRLLLFMQTMWRLIERRRTEKALRESEEKFRVSITAALDAMIMINADGKVEYWNPAAERMFGYTYNEIAGRAILDTIVPAKFRTRFEKGFRAYKKTGEGYAIDKVIEMTAKRKNGTVFPIELSVSSLQIKGQRWASANIRDITERKQAEIQLKVYSDGLQRQVAERTAELDRALYGTEKARDRLDVILKSVADGLLVTDSYNRVVLMNPAAENLLDVRYNEVMDRPIEAVINDPVLREKVKNTFDKKTSGYQFDFELPGPDPQRPQVMRARTSMVQGRQKSESGIITIISDVTHEREVDRLKSEFISTAAHELRTPLTSIQGFSEILLTRDALTSGERTRFLTHINQQAVSLANIVNDLLDISRIESGEGFTLNVQPCDAGDIIHSAVAPFEANYPMRRYEVILPENGVRVQADPDKLGQVMKNLLSNATKYSPDGGPVRVTGRVLEGHFQVSVEDEGIGMTPAQLEKVFDKFYRVDASDTAVEGTGLGMTIVKYLVEAHEGQIRVSSELGKGTTVKLMLPFQPDILKHYAKK